MNPNKNPGPVDELLFTAISRNDPEFLAASDRAYETIPRFIELLQARAANALYSAKLRFRDPDESDRLGEDRFVFLWLTGIQYYPDETVSPGSSSNCHRNFSSGSKLDSITYSRMIRFLIG